MLRRPGRGALTVSHRAPRRIVAPRASHRQQPKVLTKTTELILLWNSRLAFGLPGRPSRLVASIEQGDAVRRA